MIHFGSEFRAGSLTDISKSGLSFTYIDQDYTRITTGTFCELTLFDVIDGDSKPIMDDISAMVVYDCSVNEEKRFSLIPENKIGVEFNVLPLTRQTS